MNSSFLALDLKIRNLGERIRDILDNLIPGIIGGLNLKYNKSGGLISGDVLIHSDGKIDFDTKINILQSGNQIAIGNTAGITSQGQDTIAIGRRSGSISQGSNSVAIGVLSGDDNKGSNSISIGHSAGRTTQGSNAIALGINSGLTNQGSNSISIGNQAGETSQNIRSISIGNQAGQTSQNRDCVAIGRSAGKTTQNLESVAIGLETAETNQAGYSVCIGKRAGRTNASQRTIYIGENSGLTNSQPYAIGIGAISAQNNQGENAIAIGRVAGQTNQGGGSIAIGYLSGLTNQGSNSISIGARAGFFEQHNNSIVLNATGGTLNTGSSNAFFVAPMRGVDLGLGLEVGTVYYDNNTKELQYSIGDNLPMIKLFYKLETTSGVPFVDTLNFEVQDDITEYNGITTTCLTSSEWIPKENTTVMFVGHRINPIITGTFTGTPYDERFTITDEDDDEISCAKVYQDSGSEFATTLLSVSYNVIYATGKYKYRKIATIFFDNDGTIFSGGQTFARRVEIT